MFYCTSTIDAIRHTDAQAASNHRDTNQSHIRTTTYDSIFAAENRKIKNIRCQHAAANKQSHKTQTIREEYTTKCIHPTTLTTHHTTPQHTSSAQSASLIHRRHYATAQLTTPALLPPSHPTPLNTCSWPHSCSPDSPCWPPPPCTVQHWPVHWP